MSEESSAVSVGDAGAVDNEDSTSRECNDAFFCVWGPELVLRGGSMLVDIRVVVRMGRKKRWARRDGTRLIRRDETRQARDTLRARRDIRREGTHTPPRGRTERGRE